MRRVVVARALAVAAAAGLAAGVVATPGVATPAAAAPAGAPSAVAARSATAPRAATRSTPVPRAGASPDARYWVFFRDRGPAAWIEAERARGASGVTPRALARRARAAAARAREGIAPAPPTPDAATDPATPDAAAADLLDLPPAAPYVAAVEAAGGRVRVRSRWLDAVSVAATEAAIARIRDLPFVSEVRPVAPLESDDAIPRNRRSRADLLPHAAGPDEFDYGPSATQLDMIHVPEAHAMGYDGAGVVVGILDSGFELEHDAFRFLDVRGQRDFIHHDDDTSVDPTQDRPNQANHGTAVLSLLAGYAPGKLIGPAYGAAVLLGKTERIDVEVPTEEDTWCAGIEWMEAMGADLVTTSLSYPDWYRRRDLDGRTAVVTRMANLAFERGLLVFNSIGNYGPRPETLAPPGDAPGVIAVGAVNAQRRIVGFSSRGPTADGRVKPDVCAMGTGDRIASAAGRARYSFGGGTSYSTPLVAGVAALVIEAHPDWSPETVRDAIVMSADRADRPDDDYGWGIVNARDAILYPAIEGRIADATTGEPVARATVAWEPAAPGAVDSSRAAPSDAPPRGAVRTDSTGAYVAPNLPPGRYVLRVKADGYFDGVTEPIEVPPGIDEVNVRLRYRGE
ncbi:MAG: S8 family serine peptidase [Hyphomicrobiales bacterium]